MNDDFFSTNSLSSKEEDNFNFNIENITISPTKSLVYYDSPTHHNKLYPITSPQTNLHSKKTSKQKQIPYENYMSNSTSNSTVESFVTATSEFHIEGSSIDEKPKKNVFASLTENNNSTTTLQQTHNQNDLHYDTNFTTPKFDSPHTLTFQQESVHDNTELSKNLLMKSTTNVNQTSSTESKNILHIKYSSPRKAIRASRLINSEDFVYDKTNKNNKQKKHIKTKTIQSSHKQNDDSLLSENTINTITFDTLDLSNRIQESTVFADNEISKDQYIFNFNNYAYLFIIALHGFNAETLEAEEDIQICLSFEKNDVAFIHVADESGWGEVTLINQQKRGWVPLNYFTDVLQPELNIDKNTDAIKQTYNYISSRIPLESLLTASAKFLVDFERQAETNKILKIDLINDIRDGVKKLLQLTECVSRSDDLVKNYLDIKKTRKKLLAEWYNLMIKADHYKNSHSPKNVSTIVILLYTVIEKAFAFYASWGNEKLHIINQHNVHIYNQVNNIFHNDTQNDIISENKHLKTPPHAMERLGEIYNILFTYIGIILGRLDIIQHSSAGYESLELIVHQIIILLRELLYISKSCSYIIQQKYKYAYESTLDSNLDPLLSLVSELVSCVKILVTKVLTEDEHFYSSKESLKPQHFFSYVYTSEEKNLIRIISQMAPLIKNVVFGCNSYIRLIGNFKLGDDREYLDFSYLTVTPEDFVKKCGYSNNYNQLILNAKGKLGRLARFSSIHPIKKSKIVNNIFLDNPLDENEKEFSRNSVFDKFKLDIDCQTEEDNTSLLPINYTEIIQKEILFDNNGALVGASFRAFVLKLTDELDKPDDLLIASFLLHFRKFGNIVDLVDELITRFDIINKSSQYDTERGNGIYSSKASRLKTRRRLVCSIFQKWMESYWEFQDYDILPSMVNFFNEIVSSYLPIESKALIEVACRLFNILTNTATKTNDLLVFHQLKTTSTICPKVLSVISETSSINSLRSSVFSLDDRIINQYGLTRTKSNSSKNSKSLLLPQLEVGESSLLSDEEIEKTKKSIMFYETVTKITVDSNNEAYEVGDSLELWRKLKTVDVSTNFLVEQFNKPSFGLTDIHPLELAKQLTALESALFLRIQPMELVHYKEPNFSPNIVAILNFSNQLSNYVTETICAPYLSLIQRVYRLQTWLRIALSCAYFRNFNSVATIMASLQNHSIERLHSIWNALDKKDSTLFDYLVRIVHPNHNFKVYRTKLNSITKDHLYSKSPLPVVPFVNLYLQDLTFLDDGNPSFKDPHSFRPNKLVNVDKYIRMTKIISNLQFFQVGYSQSSLDSLDKRNSFFQVAENLSIDTDVITDIANLQEFIIFEFWKVNKYYEHDSERGYKQSLHITPRNQGH